MRGINKPTIQSLDSRLLEVDRVIISAANDGGKLLERGASVSDIDSLTEFLHEQFKRRELILWEMRKAGTTESEAYSRMRSKGGIQ